MRELKSNLIAHLANVYDGAAGNDPQTPTVVTLARGRVETDLIKVDGKIGKWEADLLNYSDKARWNGMYRLATNALMQAVQVSDLPEDEYEAGYNYQGYRRVDQDG